MVNSKTLVSSKGSGLKGKPHSKRSGPSGENHRIPAPYEVRRRKRLDTPWKQGSVTAKRGPWRRVAIDLLEVPRVAGVGENDASDAHLFDDRELEFEVLIVAAGCRRWGRRWRWAARWDRAIGSAADADRPGAAGSREDREFRPGRSARRWAPLGTAGSRRARRPMLSLMTKPSPSG